jgi:hypothetical protein
LTPLVTISEPPSPGYCCGSGVSSSTTSAARNRVDGHPVDGEGRLGARASGGTPKTGKLGAQLGSLETK